MSKSNSLRTAVTQAASKMLGRRTRFVLCLLHGYVVIYLLFPLSMKYAVSVSARTLPAQLSNETEAKALIQVSFVCFYSYFFCKKEIKTLLIGNVKFKYFSYFTPLSFRCYLSFPDAFDSLRQYPASEFQYRHSAERLFSNSFSDL